MALKKLGGRHYKAILMLASGENREAIMEATGISVKTLERWKRDPEFQKFYEIALKQCFDSGMAKLVQGVDKAIDRILQIIDDPDVASRTKLAASMFLIGHATKLIDTNLQSRLEDIEESLDNGYIEISAQEIGEEDRE